jgi:Protein of unknown function (DUF1501)
VHPAAERFEQTRREFLMRAGSGGMGLAALTHLLCSDGLAAPAPASPSLDQINPLDPKPPHATPRAKRCIFIFQDGGPSQFELFERKPKLLEMDGKKLPESFVKDVRFAFLDRDKSTVTAPKPSFQKHGECGMELSELLPHLATCVDEMCMIHSMHTDQFNHHPAQLILHNGRSELGRPTIGSWITYGLGSESQNLPGYVVLASGRGASGGATNWTSGFLPSTYEGVVFRGQGEPVLNLKNPDGLPAHLRRAGLDALRELNEAHYQRLKDPEILSRITSYELAFRMQTAAPELADLSGETRRTLDAYGVDREDPVIKAERPGGPNQYRAFATNCLLARRLIERGVRFVHLVQGTWDHHQGLDVELPFNARLCDQPIAALIHDLKQRGLLDETLVVVASEFGRTPLGEYKKDQTISTGRDHHPYAFTIFMAGGGVRKGYVHGETDEFGWAPIRDPVHVNDLQATLLHLFGLDHLRLTYRFQGLDQRLTSITRESNVVEALLA